MRSPRLRAATVVGLAALCCALCCHGPARATVPSEDAELPAPTVLTMQQGDPLAGGSGGPGAPGDYRMEYGTVAFVIGQPGSSVQGGPGPHRSPAAGGAIIDVVQLFPAARHLGLGRVGTYVGGRQVVYTRATAQRENDLGTVVVEGYDSDDPAIAVTTRYEIGPRLKIGDGVHIVTTVRNQGQRPHRSYQIGDDLRFGSLDRFTPGSGFSPPPSGARPAFLEALGPGGSLLYLPESSSVESRHAGRGSLMMAPGTDLPPGSSATYARSLLLTTDPSRSLCSRHGPLGGGVRFSGTVREEGSGAPLRATVALVNRSGEALLAVPSDGEGHFSLCASGTGDYRVLAQAAGRAQQKTDAQQKTGADGHASPGVALHLDATGGAPKDVVVTLSRQAHLRLSLRDSATRRGGPLAGRVTVIARDGQAQGPGSVALAPSSSGPGHAIYGRPDGADAFSSSGELDLLVPPGRYDVVASHGLFYDQTAQAVSLRGGETRKATLTLRRAVPQSETLGTRCAVLHVLPPSEDAVAVARGDDLDVVLLSDEGTAPHGLGGDLLAVPGSEAMAEGRGRYELYPVPPGTALPDLRRSPAPAAALLALRAVAGERPPGSAMGAERPVLQAILPGSLPPGHDGVDSAQRSGPLQPGSFGAEGTASLIDAWEVWTGADSATGLANLRRYLGALDQGLVAAVGGADPGDDANRSAPRTCYGRVQAVRAPSTGMELAAAVRRGDLLVTNGPLLRVTANGAAQGELAAAPDGKLTLSITALASPWVDIRELLVYVGPHLATRIPVPAGVTPLRYQGQTTLTLAIDRDAAIVVVATGERPLSPLLPGIKPLAFTNPLRVDRDGDGRFGGARQPPVKQQQQKK